jgi:periplasmic divalent cation tolerance protein
MSDFVLALTTVPGDFDAAAFAQEAVATGVAACVTIVPGVRSVYNWQGVPTVDHEQQLLMKTTTEWIDRLWDLVRERHPYEVPEFIVVPVVDGSKDYLTWMDQNVGPKAES